MEMLMRGLLGPSFATFAMSAALWSVGAAQALEIPAAGDCRRLAAAAGEVWYGSFSGTRLDFWDRRELVFVEGCFPSEYLCRRWVNEVQTAVIDPGLMRCVPLTARR